MSSLYRTHLQKELRENRSLLLGLIVIVVFACAAIAIAIEQTKRPTPDAPSFAVLCAMALVAFTLGPESLGREAARNRPAAIARLPGGLLRPFLARITVYFTTFVLLSAFAYALEIAFLHLFVTRGIEIARFASHRIAYGLGAFGALLALVPGPWLKQTMLGAPAGVLLGGSLVGAWLVLPASNPALRVFFSDHASSLIAIVVVAALFAAWRGFRALHTHSGGRLAATLHGVFAFYLLSFPVVAYAGHRAFDWATFPRDARDFVIEQVVAVEGGRRLLMEMSRDRGDVYPTFVVELDFARRALRPIARDAYLGVIEPRHQRTSDRWRLLSFVVGDSFEHSLIDTATGELHTVSRQRDKASSLPSDFRRALRENSLLQVNGERAWLENARFMVDGPDGPELVREFTPEEFVTSYYAAEGLGLVVRSDGINGNWSFWFTNSGVEVPFDGRRERFIHALDGPRILVRSEKSSGYFLRDERGTAIPLPGIEPGEEVALRVDGRHVLVYRPSPTEPNPIVLLDVFDGKRHATCFEDGSPATAQSAISAAHLDAAAGGSPILRIRCAEDWLLARFDAETSTLVRAHRKIGFDAILASHDDAIVIDHSGRSIERVYFGSDRYEVLFPFSTEP